jgi:hypothetical protein
MSSSLGKVKKFNISVTMTLEDLDVLDTQQGVVFSDTLASGGSTGLDLADTQCDSKVGDDRVLSLAATVGDHDTPAIGLRKLSTMEPQGSVNERERRRTETNAWIDSEMVPIWLT